jgi:GGDEF domain-containing protein
MDKNEFIVSFPDVSGADADRLAESLRVALLEAHAEIEADRRRVDSSSMSFGSELAIVLSAPAAIAAARALSAWAMRSNVARIIIKNASGAVLMEAKGMRSPDVPELVKAFTTGER